MFNDSSMPNAFMRGVRLKITLSMWQMRRLRHDKIELADGRTQVS